MEAPGAAFGECPFCGTRFDAAAAACPNADCRWPLLRAEACSATDKCGAYADGDLKCGQCGAARPVLQQLPVSEQTKDCLREHYCPKCGWDLERLYSIMRLRYKDGTIEYRCDRCHCLLPPSTTTVSLYNACIG